MGIKISCSRNGCEDVYLCRRIDAAFPVLFLRKAKGAFDNNANLSLFFFLLPLYKPHPTTCIRTRHGCRQHFILFCKHVRTTATTIILQSACHLVTTFSHFHPFCLLFFFLYSSSPCLFLCFFAASWAWLLPFS